jgi:fido (protein-threonine AMPylation protein)
MVTKYDIFEVVYKKRSPLKAKEVVAELSKTSSDYKAIWMALDTLVKVKLLMKTKEGFEVKTSSKTTLLYNLISYCLHNKINYNLLIDKNLVSFIANGLKQGQITSKNSKCSPKTLQKYVEVLREYGLLLIIAMKPIKVRVFYNSLVKNLLLYFDFKLFVKQISANYMKSIEQEFKKFKTLRKKNEAGYKRIVENLEMSFVHHSLSLEGNPITLPDTLMILKEKIIPVKVNKEALDEVLNYQNAIVQMLNDKKKLTLRRILSYHKTAMHHKPHMAGIIRDVGVHIRGNPDFNIAKVGKIELQLKKLLDKYNEFVKKKNKSMQDRVEFATYFHSEFQHIHPFEDGNSRTTRLLTFYILQSEGIPILDIPFGLLDEYMLNTKKAKKRNDESLFEHLQRVILYNLTTVNGMLKV